MLLKNAFPPNHLREYYKWVDADKNKATALCTLNVVVSGSLYPALNMFEVTLRESINKSFVDYFGIDWSFQGIVRYHTKNLQRYTDPKASAYNHLKLSKTTVNSMVISDSNLFYWTNIIDPINSQLWEHEGVKSIFRPDTEINQVEIFNKINELRKLRNRIAHLKSIIQRNLLKYYNYCREILGLLSQDSLSWCDSNCNFWKIHPDDTIIKKGKLSPNFDITPWLQYQVKVEK